MIIDVLLGRGFQILGRIVLMDFVQQHLRTKKNTNFNDIQKQPIRKDIEVMADIVFVKVRYYTKNQNYKFIYITN